MIFGYKHMLLQFCHWNSFAKCHEREKKIPGIFIPSCLIFLFNIYLSCQPAFFHGIIIYLDSGKNDKLSVIRRIGLALLKSVSTGTSGFSRINVVGL